MSSMPVASLQLLRAFRSPQRSSCFLSQTRSASNFMPRKKYAAVTRLDKLHRKEKDETRAAKVAAQARSEQLTQTLVKSNQANRATSMPFHIERTGTGNVPVYETSKNGGSKRITTLRKLSGDLDAVKTALIKTLDLQESYVGQDGRKKTDISINRLTSHVIVQGWRGAEIKAWAQTVGF